MADTKISGLTAASAAAAANEFPINEAGNSRKLTLAQIETYLQTKGMPRVKRLGTQHSISVIAPTKVTDLDMTLEVGTFIFEYWLLVRSATTTVAPQFNFNFTGTGVPSWWYQYADLSATLLAAIGQVANNVSTQTLGFMMAQAENVEATTAAGNMGPVQGVQSTGVDHLVKISGIVVVTAGGDLQLYHGSETASQTMVEVGSSLIVYRTA